MSKKILVVLAVALAFALGAGLWRLFTTAELGWEKALIDETANQISEIKSIGQWEFLSVDSEVLVDTIVHRHFPFSDKRLARIYRGTVRIGVDLASAAEGWFENVGDSLAVLTLPPISILDSRFIDEANTTAFYESGQWDAAAKEEMYGRASERMLASALSPANMKMAAEQAEIRFTALFRALGFSQVWIRYE